MSVVLKAFARTREGQLCSLHPEEPPWRIIYQPGEYTASGPRGTPLFAFQTCEEQVAMTFLHKRAWNHLPGFIALELWQCEAERVVAGAQQVPYATDYRGMALYWRTLSRLLAGGKQIDLREWKKCLHNSRLSCPEHPLTSAPWGTLFCWGLVPVQQVFVRLPPQNRARKEA
jgi:hypothetical protein